MERPVFLKKAGFLSGSEVFQTLADNWHLKYGLPTNQPSDERSSENQTGTSKSE